MMNRHKLLLVLMIPFLVVSGYGQKGKVRRASQDYEKFNYVKVTEILEEVANKGYESADLFEKLGNSYYFNNKMEDASRWYKALFELNEPVDSEYYFRYAQALKFIGNYEESDSWMKRFYESNSNDIRAKNFIGSVDYLAKIDSLTQEITLTNLDINTSVSDFGSAQYDNGLIFSSSRDDGKLYSWNDQPFLELYKAERQEDGSYSNVKKLDANVNTKYHESSVAFTPDGQTMYFTRNNYYRGKSRKDDQGVNRLKLYRAQLQEDGSWSDIASVHFNSDDYSVAHPTINASGTQLYFASDMPGSIGLSDIYKVDIKDDGRLGTPINLGARINTEAQESFPFINTRGDLYFSSNGYAGLGGLDVYVIRNYALKRHSAERLEIDNLGKPINSAQDDFGYYENLDTKEGFISSNRFNGKGDDDIYSFTLPGCAQLLEGIVKDKNTQELLPGAIVILYDDTGEEISKAVANIEAYFSFSAQCNATYLVRAEKESYIPDEKRLTTPEVKQELHTELLLEKDEKEIKVGDDLAKVLEIPIIYFDFDKYNIRYDASLELEKILAVLNRYPNMEIDIRSHTDCRAPRGYNETLSDNRAKSTREYLIDKGIASSRMTAKGYGEYQLMNRCSCEDDQAVSCSEEEHQLNRRSEFIITKM